MFRTPSPTTSHSVAICNAAFSYTTAAGHTLLFPNLRTLVIPPDSGITREQARRHFYYALATTKLSTKELAQRLQTTTSAINRLLIRSRKLYAPPPPKPTPAPGEDPHKELVRQMLTHTRNRAHNVGQKTRLCLRTLAKRRTPTHCPVLNTPLAWDTPAHALTSVPEPHRPAIWRSEPHQSISTRNMCFMSELAVRLIEDTGKRTDNDTLYQLLNHAPHGDDLDPFESWVRWTKNHTVKRTQNT